MPDVNVTPGFGQPLERWKESEFACPACACRRVHQQVGRRQASEEDHQMTRLCCPDCGGMFLLHQQPVRTEDDDRRRAAIFNAVTAVPPT